LCYKPSQPSAQAPMQIQSFHEDCFLRVCENVFGKTENKFVGGRYYGKPILLVIENKKFANMSLFLLVKDFPK
jgi:hypothetical protein